MFIFESVLREECKYCIDGVCSYAGCHNKIDLVCDAILKCLDDLGGDSTHLLATISALVKKTTPELETVLTKIKQLQGVLWSLVILCNLCRRVDSEASCILSLH